ncbi:MAG: T9SS type A sorting domain-containing protein [Vicingaceae bacterium]|nr:T9SS type A sorting domain-containing protein [Vicingaceae bacterium]
MKSILLLFILGIASLGHTQVYQPMLGNLNEWKITNCNSAGCLSNTYFIDGDTTFSGFHYQILNGFHFISKTFWLREDSLAQKVYFSYDTGTRREILLYDFSLQVGDSMDMKNPITPFPSDAGYFTVDSINTEQLYNGNLYRHYYFSPSTSNTTSSNNAEWIEGVGSLSLINASSGKPDINDVGALSCFFKNEQLIYANLDSISECINIYTDLKEDNSSNKNINIYPTLVEKELHITNIKSMKDLSIYDINGMQLKKASLENIAQIDLSIKEFKSGIYFIVLSDTQYNRSTYKIIKK